MLVGHFKLFLPIDHNRNFNRPFLNINSHIRYNSSNKTLK